MQCRLSDSFWHFATAHVKKKKKGKKKKGEKKPQGLTGNGERVTADPNSDALLIVCSVNNRLHCVDSLSVGSSDMGALAFLCSRRFMS